MELKTGYKNTELGLIPSDWGVYFLGHLLNGIADVDHYMPKTEKYGVPYVMTGDLKDLASDIDFDNCKKISPSDYDKLSKKVKNLKGDIILARYATVGTVAFVNIDFDFVVSYSCVTIKPDTSKLIELFLYYYFKSSIFKLEVKNKVNANIQDNVGIGDLIKMKIPLPPTKSEQTAIVNALSEVDNLIIGLAKLITKKRNIKQGAMQKLLQPKEGWEVKKLGDISEIYTGKKNNQDKVENGQYPFFVRSQSIESINTYSFDGEAILIPGEGNIGKIFHYINGKFDYHQRVYKISDFKDGYFGKYIYRYISEYFGNHAMQNSVKATVDSLRLPTFQVFEIPFPPTYAEQVEIATILSDMDEEIDCLETKLEKYKSIKQGMMQNLLTGKIRLV
jgi:type I restriction enzyme S subunit